MGAGSGRCGAACPAVTVDMPAAGRNSMGCTGAGEVLFNGAVLEEDAAFGAICGAALT